MKMQLIRDNAVIAEKRLVTQEDFDRVADAICLEYQGEYYTFAGSKRDEDGIIQRFVLMSMPVSVDGFVNRVAS